MEMKQYLVYFRYCFVANIILFFGLLTHDRIYIDDIGRSISGYFINWYEVGRPLSDVFLYLVHLGYPFVNISPLPQILSIFIVSVGCVSLSKCYSIKSPFVAAVCTLPIAGQPYFLQNMSYNFDSPTMALGLVLSIFAAIHLIGGKKHPLMVSIGLLFLSLNLYQPSVGAFFATYLFLLIKNVDTEIKPHKYFGAHAYNFLLCSGCSFLLYWPITRILMKVDYAKEHSKFVGFAGWYDTAYANTVNYFRSIINDWSGNAIGYVFAILFLAVLVTLILQINEKPGKKDTNRKYAAVYSIACVIIGMSTVLVSYFPQMFLESPVIAPRIFVGIGPILSCCCLSLCCYMESSVNASDKYRKYITAVPVCIVAYALILFAYSYSKASSSQDQYEGMVLTRLIADTDVVTTDRNIKYVAISGSIGRSLLFQNTAKKYPLMDSLVPVDVEDWHVGYSKLNYMGLDLLRANISEQDKSYIMAYTSPIINKSRYAVYLVRNLMLIRFHPH